MMTTFQDSITDAVDRAVGNSAPIQGRFDYGRTLDGFEVVDRDTGRPVGFSYTTAQEANGKCYQLNGIAVSGDRRALARALRAA
jgi:hypothetical protein